MKNVLVGIAIAVLLAIFTCIAVVNSAHEMTIEYKMISGSSPGVAAPMALLSITSSSENKITYRIEFSATLTPPVKGKIKVVNLTMDLMEKLHIDITKITTAPTISLDVLSIGIIENVPQELVLLEKEFQGHVELKMETKNPVLIVVLIPKNQTNVKIHGIGITYMTPLPISMELVTRAMVIAAVCLALRGLLWLKPLLKKSLKKSSPH